MTAEKQRTLAERVSWLKMAKMFEAQGGVSLIAERARRDKQISALIEDGLLKEQPNHPAPKGQTRFRATQKGLDWVKRTEQRLVA